MSSNEYPAPGQGRHSITPDDVAAFVVPDSPASLVPEAPTRPIPSTAELLAAWEAQNRNAAAVVPAPVAAAPEGPLVPRWVVRAGVVTLSVSAMAGVVAFVVWGVAQALGAAAAALAGAVPYLVGVGVVALAAVILTRRKSNTGSLSVSVSQTQHVTITKK